MDHPSKHFVIIEHKDLEKANLICKENIGKANFIFSLEIGDFPAQLYFRKQEDLNLFKLITSRDFYADTKKEKAFAS